MAWLYRVAHNQLIDCLRKERHLQSNLGLDNSHLARSESSVNSDSLMKNDSLANSGAADLVLYLGLFWICRRRLQAAMPMMIICIVC